MKKRFYKGGTLKWDFPRQDYTVTDGVRTEEPCPERPLASAFCPPLLGGISETLNISSVCLSGPPAKGLGHRRTVWLTVGILGHTVSVLAQEGLKTGQSVITAVSHIHTKQTQWRSPPRLSYAWPAGQTTCMLYGHRAWWEASLNQIQDSTGSTTLGTLCPKLLILDGFNLYLFTLMNVITSRKAVSKFWQLIYSSSNLIWRYSWGILNLQLCEK